MERKDFEIKLVSSLDKVFPNGEPALLENEGSCLKNERFHFQVCIRSEYALRLDCKVSAESAFGDKVFVRTVECIPGRYTRRPDGDDWVIFQENKAAAYPDLLMPIHENGIRLCPQQWQSLWVTVDGGSEALPAGKYPIRITVSDGNGLFLSAVYTLTVVDALLPPSDLIYTNWLHYDCLCERYDCEPFSEKFYTVLGSYLSEAVGHGMNMLYVPLFTPPLDTEVGRERKTVQLVRVYKNGESFSFDFGELKKFLSFALKKGIRYFEMSHLATQWGGKYCPKIVASEDGNERKIFGWETSSCGREYEAFLRCLLPELDNFLKREGYAERVYFHISDEPSEEDNEGYAAAAKIIRQLLPGYRFMDAMSEPVYYRKGLVDVPVVATNAFSAFKPSPEWTYYCCGQFGNYESNRFFNMPSIRNRILGAQLYETGTKGFLHWGFNFYNSQYSRYPVDPYFQSDADGGFQSGDSFIVYPGRQGALASLRLEVFFDGLQDVCALRAAEKKIGREELLRRLHKIGVSGFTGRIDAVTWLKFRKEINALLA